MAKNVRYMTTKEQLSRFRNLTKGMLLRQKESIHTNILHCLPDKCQSLSHDEVQLLRKLTATYNDLIATWDYRTKELLNNVNNNI